MLLQSAGAMPGEIPASPRPPRRAARRTVWFAAGLAVLVALLFAVRNSAVVVSGHGTTSPVAERAYGPQPERTAEWTGNPDGPMSQVAIETIARHNGIDIWPKWAGNFSLADHFAETRKLVDTAKQYGNDLKVFDYFSASFWFSWNTQTWGAYGPQFQQSWLMRDRDGSTIPFYGIRTTSESGLPPKGYLIDLRNPDYRAWAVRTIVSWMQSAPYAGIAFDSANPLVASTQVRSAIGDDAGAQTYSSLLCGSGSVQCAAVNDWNAGLVDLLHSTTVALHAMGKQVFYNGIAPSPQRASDRNIGLLAQTDGALNESFCATVRGANPTRPSTVTRTSIPDDLAIMQRIAAEHKKVIEITNYQNPTLRDSLGEYCLAGFLMGWQPGSSYYVYHASYKHALRVPEPAIPEQSLRLGNPTAQFVADGSLLTRSFQNGFVAVNIGDSSARVRIPITGVQFASGAPGKTLSAGTNTTLSPHSALYLLSTTYLHG